MILLHLQIGDARIRVQFEVVDNLVTDLLIGIYSIDKYMRKSFSAERKLVSWLLRPIYIILLPSKTQLATTVADRTDSQPIFTLVADDTYHKVVVANSIILAPYTHTLPLVTSGGLDMVVVKPTHEHAGYKIM